MKIALAQHLTASYWGGGEKEMWELSRGLTRLGHKVDVFAVPYTLENRRKVDRSLLFNDGVGYHENLVNVIDADVVYSMYHPFSRLSFVTTAPSVTSFHSLLWFADDRSGYGLIPRAAGWLGDQLMWKEINSYAAVHVHYDSIKAKLSRKAPRHPPIYVIDHFVDTQLFHPAQSKADQFTALYLGRPVWQKGFDTFERLAKDLRGTGIRFQYVGGVSKEPGVESFGLKTNEKEISSFLSEAHVLVAPSRVDSAGRNLLEALSCGTPVITNPRLDWPLLECEGVLKAGDYSAVRLTLLSILESWKRGGYEALSTCARRCAVDYFDYERTILRYEQMLHDVANGRGLTRRNSDAQ